jgi:release factor glutamine methyltransferase
VTQAPDRAPLTIEAARRDLARRFREAGIDSPELDARLIVGAALGLDLTALVAQSQAMLPRDAAARIAAFAERRLGGEPMARILGEKEFWGLRFALSPATLVPRPDTETVVAAALDFARGRDPLKGLRIVDIGTGSGAILLALLTELSHASGIGTDIARGALMTAKQNAEALGLRDRAEFVLSDYFSAVSGTFDVIVSNPPYIRTADIESLSREVRGHEPYGALDGGADGLGAYRTLCAQAPAHLAPGGALIVEVGHDQADAVADLMEAAGLNVVKSFRCDLAGIPRAVEGHK